MKYLFFFKASGAFVFLIILFANINGLAQKTPNPKEVSAHIGKNTPVTSLPLQVRAGHSYTFKTFNLDSNRKVKVIVARKKGNGYEVVGSMVVLPRQCGESQPIKAKENDEFVMAYKCKAKIIFYNNIDKIGLETVDECTPIRADISGPIAPRPGVRGTAGGTGTATTTVDEH